MPTPAAPAATHHGRPGTPPVTTVGGLGAWDRDNPGRAGHDPLGAFPDHTQGRFGPHSGATHWPGDGLLLLYLALGEVPVPSLECVTLVSVDKDGRLHLMHSLFCVRVEVYSTECRLFACLGELPAEGLPPIIEVSPDFFAARCSVHAVPQSDRIACLGGISPLDWQTEPCKRAVGPYHIQLACRGMAFFPSDCMAWLLRREADGTFNVFDASAGLFPMLTSREPPFEVALD